MQWRQKNENEEYEEEEEKIPEGLSKLFQLGREHYGKRHWLVHERDRNEFWTMMRWYVVRPVLIFRYAVNEARRPAGITDIRYGETAARENSPEIFQLRVDEFGEFLEARFESVDEADEFRAEIEAQSYNELKSELWKAQEKNNALSNHNHSLEAELVSARARIQSLEEALELARNEREIALDRTQAVAAVNTAKSAQTLRKAKEEHDALAQSRFKLHAETEAWRAAATEAQADASNSGFVAREARRRHRAEKKLLLKQIRDLQKRLAKSETAKELRDQVTHFWQDNFDTTIMNESGSSDSEDDEDIRWLLDQPLLEEQKRLEEHLCSRKEPIGNALTPEQLAFLRSAHNQHTQKQQNQESPALLRSLFQKIQSRSFLPPAASPTFVKNKNLGTEEPQVDYCKHDGHIEEVKDKAIYPNSSSQAHTVLEG